MASGRFSRDDQVLEAIFNPVGGLDVSVILKHTVLPSLAVQERSDQLFRCSCSLIIIKYNT